MTVQTNDYMKKSLARFGIDPYVFPELPDDLKRGARKLREAADPLADIDLLLPGADKDDAGCRFLCLDDRLPERTTDGRVLRDGLAVLHLLHDLLAPHIAREEVVLSLSYWCDVGIDDDDRDQPYDQGAVYAYIGDAAKAHSVDDLSAYVMEGVLRLA